MSDTNFSGVDAAGFKIGGVPVTATAAELNKLASSLATAAQLNQLLYTPGKLAVGVVDFNTGAAEAACKITIGGVDYQEADAADAPNGVWTNGASQANSTDSFLAAVNGDTRASKPAVTALKIGTHSVAILSTAAGTAGNLEITTTSAAKITVENMVGGAAGGVKQVTVINRTVTAQDVLATAVVIPVAFTPTGWMVQVLDATYALKAATGVFDYSAGPPKYFSFTVTGASALVAGDHIYVVAMS
jgi:hypothetical protein